MMHTIMCKSLNRLASFHDILFDVSIRIDFFVYMPAAFEKYFNRTIIYIRLYTYNVIRFDNPQKYVLRRLLSLFLDKSLKLGENDYD